MKPKQTTSFKKIFSGIFSIVIFIASQSVFAGRESISFSHIGTEQGLPQSTVNTIYQDSKGFIWIGTYDGLTRFDGYRFTNFKNNPQDLSTLSHNTVVSIVEDKQGFLWVGTAQNGVSRLNPNTGKFTRYLSSQSDDYDSLSSPQVRVIHQDPKGRIWVGTNHGLNLFLPEKNAFAHFLNNPLDNQSLPKGAITDIVDDGEGNLWIGGTGSLAHFDIEQQVFSQFNQLDSPRQINDLYLDTDNSLWIGTKFDGLFHKKQGSRRFDSYRYQEQNADGLSSNNVQAILRVRSGDLWVGTEEGGVSVRRKGDNRFIRFLRNSADQHSLTINDVWSLFQDQSGLIWVGTAGGGINTTMAFENRLSRLTHDPIEKNSLSHEFVWDVEEDKHGYIWFATLNGLDKYNPQDETFVHYSEFSTKQNQTIGNRVQAFTFDNKGRIWFGNQQGQLAVFTPYTNQAKLIYRKGFPRGYVSTNRIRMIEIDRFENIWVGTDDGLLKVSSNTDTIISDYNYTNEEQLSNTLVRTMLQDQDGSIWFGTWNQGLQQFDPEFNTTKTFENIPNNIQSISNNTVRSLYKDSEGNLWIGTFNGLNLLTAEEIQNKTYRFKRFLEKDGLANSAIYSIVGAANGKIWLSTNKGLSEFDPVSLSFTNYSVADGLTSNEFNGNAGIKALDNKIYFGSVNGVSIVNPGAVVTSSFEPKIQFTAVNIHGREYIPAGINYNQQLIELNYKNNDIRLAFAALDFRHPARNLFRYRLKPYDEKWSTAAPTNNAVFTNLDPNLYEFELQATNSDGEWVEQTISLSFIIHPPMWKTWWAKFLYIAGFIGLIGFLLNRQEKSLQEQKAINEHLRKVDQIKDEFLANTSHELRTPLNGIIGIAESLKEGVAGLQNKNTLNHLQLIIDGGKRLSQLVNDILDFKKLSHHNLILQRKAVDLNSIVNVVINLLKPLSTEKKLILTNNISAELPLIYADENRIQQVLHNLIGNAIKYTQKGEVTITATSKNNFVEVCVLDTGIGINGDDLQNIFKPFEQAELKDTISHRGTGLGLSVSSQLVEEHGGEIWAESELGKGSKFYFNIPMWLENEHEIETTKSIQSTKRENVALNKKVKKSIQKPQTSPTKIKAKVLIADDDPINLQVLSDLLIINGYEVESAPDGLQAVELGENNHYDLAIIDVMMPGLSGYDVCKKLRKKYTAIELPILLLSARNQPGDINAGFEAGANDYVTKPIEREILLSRIHTMVLLGGLVEAKQQKEHAATLQQACEKLGKYFPEQMVRQIVTNNNNEQLVAKRKQVTILFADLVGFTSISDRFEPEMITEILNGFLGKMGKLIEANNGVLNEILGDGLVVLFGALDNMSKQEQAMSAAKLALQMQQAMKQLEQQWLEAGIDHNVKLRVGIHQDFATVGNFGSEDIVAFRAVGSGINLAARIESYSKPDKITVSYPIYAQCKDSFEFSPLEEVQFKGFNHPHRVCQLINAKSNSD